MDLKLYNTLSHKKELFEPLKKIVGLYTCGPTVYNFQHLGNYRTYIFEDTLKRVLLFNAFRVKHVMNITDVGHLTDDADNGEDKMEKGSRREGKSAWKIADFYTADFKKDIAELNIIEPTVWCKATDHIKEQIALVTTLQKKGYTYETTDGIYFNTTRFPSYGELVRLKKQELQAGTRVAMGEKKNEHDFALWKFTRPGEKRQMEWNAFRHKGFPGWHIECSAMSIKYLGKQFDIHCGGVDHMSVHHTNEIAQSECATGKHPWVRYWLHGEFLLIGADGAAGDGAGEKMAKSGENFITLATLKQKGISPLAYRYLLLQTHYRKQLAFSWQALRSAESGLQNLYQTIARYDKPKIGCAEFEKNFKNAINDDLNMPQALALMWRLIKSDYPSSAKLKTLFEFDKVLGLNIKAEWKRRNQKVPKRVMQLVHEREKARLEKNWQRSDELREALEHTGYRVEDTPHGPVTVKMV